MKTENDIYNDIETYIYQKQHKRPCTLATIKKDLRTKKIIELVFTRPDVFNLEAEIKHVPNELLTDAILVKYVLAKPKRFKELDDSLISLPVMIAFEFAKRRYEHISAIMWGPDRERIYYPQNISKYKSDISKICDTLTIKYNDKEILEDYLKYTQTVSDEILNFCALFTNELSVEEKYVSRYTDVDFELNKRLFIFVSGGPDSGKTYFSSLLASKFKNSTAFDSDMLLNRDLLLAPLSSLIKDEHKVIIFSDLYADRFFNKKELGDAMVVNVVMKPISIEVMYRNSKYMQNMEFGDYKRTQIKYKTEYETVENPITVVNDYTEKIFAEADRVIEEIATRFNISLQEKSCVKTLHKSDSSC